MHGRVEARPAANSTIRSMGVRLRAALPWVLLFVGLALGVTAFRRRHVIVRNTTDLPVGIDIRISDLRSGVLTIPPGERRIVAINGFVTEDASMLVHIGGTKVATAVTRARARLQATTLFGSSGTKVVGGAQCASSCPR